ncbi:hypothetical protein E4S40_00280 [Algoriphagus kandeliae]|uniref:Potassium transporter KefB n=1 Tax=Algoriphagus kandeliae TaxID=2562278 RepID=A0A4Y9QXR5_9BACT|nr:hypothetical protein [Algoriphagus kandeliae]TFV97129.1 hypothetical protein E4S40_00280 [Algoriphagus kandeliae]
MNPLTSPPPIRTKDLLLPAVLGLVLPTVWLVFLALANENIFQPWMYLPLTLIPLSGSAGAIFFYFMGFHWFPHGTKKLIAIIFSSILYFIILWLTSVFIFNYTGHWH